MDLNCDLGEGESLAHTRSLLKVVTSANIACGGHAGNVPSMRQCLRLARELGVHPGAHPSFPDRKNFGRLEHPITGEELTLLLAHQVGALALLADAEQIPLTHIKLHGALYHVVERHDALARALIAFVCETTPTLRLIAPPDGRIARLGRDAGVTVWGELFADRAYEPEGHLVARTRPGAVLEDLSEIRNRLTSFRTTGKIPAIDGSDIPLAAQTVCIHSDSPHALLIAGIAREVFAGQ